MAARDVAGRPRFAPVAVNRAIHVLHCLVTGALRASVRYLYKHDSCFTATAALAATEVGLFESLGAVRQQFVAGLECSNIHRPRIPRNAQQSKKPKVFHRTPPRILLAKAYMGLR